MTASPDLIRLVQAALAEDVGPGDWTSEWTVPADLRARAVIVAKADGVIAGMAAAHETLRQIDARIAVRELVGDGMAVEKGAPVLELTGSVRSILTAERVALNFLQRLSGVATLTRAYVKAVEGTGAVILDTRKTTPSMRALEKAAVALGGGRNHRFGLHDMVLIKENHVAAAGGIRNALEAVERANRQALPVEIEVRSLDELTEVLSNRVDRVLLDNFSLVNLRAGIAQVRAKGETRPSTEASGGITLGTIREVAETGVDFISVGALTHSAPALDLSLLLQPQ